MKSKKEIERMLRTLRDCYRKSTIDFNKNFLANNIDCLKWVLSDTKKGKKK